MKTSILLRRFIVTAFAVVLLSSMAWGDERIARFKQGLFLYSNWDAPHVTLDTCLDMTIYIPICIPIFGWLVANKFAFALNLHYVEGCCPRN